MRDHTEREFKMNRIHLSIMAALAGLLALSAPRSRTYPAGHINGYSVIDMSTWCSMAAPATIIVTCAIGARACVG